MEIRSALLSLSAENIPLIGVTGSFPAQKAVIQSIDDVFVASVVSISVKNCFQILHGSDTILLRCTTFQWTDEEDFARCVF